MFNSSRHSQTNRPPSRSRRHESRRRTLSVRPVIEGLEERLVLSTILWDSTNSPAGGSWDTGTNWVGGNVPGATDDAVVNLTSPGTVTLGSSVSATLNSLTTNANTSLTMNTFSLLSLAATSSIGGGLTQAGGTVTGAGTLTVSGLMTWTGGYETGSGITNADGGMTIGGSDNIYDNECLDGRTLNNLGAATLTRKTSYPSPLLLSDGATFVNEAGASFSFIADTSIDSAGGTPSGGTFINNGTLAKTGGAGTSVLDRDIKLNNTGVIEVDSGTLSLEGGGTISGSSAFAVNSGADLDFDNHLGTAFAVPSGSSIVGSGAGTISFTSGTVAINGTYSVDGLTYVNGGEVNFNSSASTGTLIQSDGTIGGTGTLSVSGLMTWNGGVESGAGSTNAGGGINIDGNPRNGFVSDAFLDGRTLNNEGTATLTNSANYSYGLSLMDGATFDNFPGASFSIIADVSIDGNTPDGGTFINDGTLAKTGGSGTSVLGTGMTLTNTGTIEADSGTLSLQGGGTISGSSALIAKAGADLDFGAGSYIAPSGSSIGGSGTGTISFSGGTVTVNGTYADAGLTVVLAGEVDFNSSASIGTLIQSDGAIGGSGTLAVSGLMTWNGGYEKGAGITSANGGMTIGGSYTASAIVLDERTLNNQGEAMLATYGELALTGGATFDNEPGASFSFTDDVSMDGYAPGGGTFINDGTLAKTGGSGLSALRSGVTLKDAGTILASSGTLSLQGTFSNFSSVTNTLTGGTYIVSAYLQIPGANIDTNAAAITLNGPLSAIFGYGASSALSNLTTNTSTASLTLLAGRNLTTQGAFNNAGAVTVGTGSQFTALGAYTQTGGSTNLAGGTLTSSSATVAINGGLLGGAGTVNGNVTSSGQVVPGGVGVAGVVNISGTYSQGAAGSMTVNLGGPNPGSGYSQLTVSGKATLGGTLYVSLVNGFAPGGGATFQVLNYGSDSGQFASVVPTNFPVGTFLSTGYTASSLVLTSHIASTLQSIAVAPANPSVALGLSEQFTAIGTYSDHSTADLTNQVTWASANLAVATISNRAGSQGLAATLALGASTVTASLNGVSGTTTLTVVTAATVSSVSVSWGTAGSAALVTAADGIRLLPVGRSTDLPWQGINKINVTLSQAATLTSANVTVTSAAGVNYGLVTVSGSGANYVITLAKPINAADRVTFTIGSSTVATFTRRLDVLPGDVNDDGAVTLQDAVFVRNEYLGFAPVTIPVTFLDVNGDGVVDVKDYNVVHSLIGTKLPAV